MEMQRSSRKGSTRYGNSSRSKWSRGGGVVIAGGDGVIAEKLVLVGGG
jgi:hypothetical protein